MSTTVCWFIEGVVTYLLLHPKTFYGVTCYLLLDNQLTFKLTFNFLSYRT